MQIISSEKNVESNTVQGLKVFNFQSLAKQAKNGEQLVYITPFIEKAFGILGDHIVQLSIDNETLKNKIGSYDEKWLEKSKAKLLKQFNVD